MSQFIGKCDLFPETISYGRIDTGGSGRGYRKDNRNPQGDLLSWRSWTMDRGRLIFRRTVSAYWGHQLLYSILILMGLFLIGFSLLLVAWAMTRGIGLAEYPGWIPFIIIGGGFFYWGLSNRYIFGRMTFAIFENGILSPYPIKSTLSKEKHRFIPFEDIEAIYTNEYASKKADPEIIVRLKTGGDLSIDYYLVGRIPPLVRKLSGRVRVHRDRDMIVGQEIFHPSASVHVREGEILIHTQEGVCTIPLADAVWFRTSALTGYPTLKLKDGRRIGFRSMKLSPFMRLRESVKKKPR